MNWASSVSDATDLETAIRHVCADVQRDLSDRADLAILFVSHHYAPRGGEAGTIFKRLYRSKPLLIGCSAGGVIGGGREVEHRAGVALTAAHLPGVEVIPFTIDSGVLPNADAPPGHWHEVLGVPPEPTPHFILLADPFSSAIEHLLAGLDYAYPRSTKVGGLASGARSPGGNHLYCNDMTLRSGGVGVALTGNIRVDTIVAQGCRPIGTPLRITRCQDNVLLELDGESPFKVLQELIPRLSEDDRELLRQALSLGIAVDELGLEQQQQHGAYLIRNLIGVDPMAGALIIGERLREGQTVQFHVRDASTSAADLETLLGRFVAAGRPPASSGALLFSCLGRGEHLYGRADHDTDLFRDKLGALPLGGFFCSGEIGPVAGATRVHGFTSSFGVFSEARPTRSSF